MAIRRSISAQLLFDAEHYTELVLKAIAGARVSLWIATANLKEMRIEAPIGTVARAKGRYLSILETLDELVGRGVELRLLHASRPSRPFAAELTRHPRLKRGGLGMRMCPRVHMKLVAIDGRLLYLGSANFTGAGLGAKGEGRRNFEIGLMTEDDVILDVAQARFDRIFSGKECAGCKLRGVCPKPIDTLLRKPAKTAPAKPSRGSLVKPPARKA